MLHHFPSRDELLIAVLERRDELDLAAVIGDSPPAPDPAAALQLNWLRPSAAHAAKLPAYDEVREVAAAQRARRISSPGRPEAIPSWVSGGKSSAKAARSAVARSWYASYYPCFVRTFVLFLGAWVRETKPEPRCSTGPWRWRAGSA